MNITLKTNPTIRWNRSSFPPIAMSNPMKPRGWQKKAFSKLSRKRHVILNTPTGSGKTLAVQMLSLEAMESNPSLKVIISTPQTIIGLGFGGETSSSGAVLPVQVKVPGIGTRTWSVNRMLCNKVIDDSKLDAFKKFMESRQRVMVCSHTILVRAFAKFPNLFKNVMVWFDEAHHVQNADTDVGLIWRNETGKLLEYLLNASSTKVGMVTATMFRGDQTAILTKEQEDNFEKYELPYDKYMDDMRYLEEFYLQYLPCSLDFVSDFGQLLSMTGIKRDIIFVPVTSSLKNFTSGDKYQVVDAIIEKYRKVHGGKIRKTGVLTEIINKGKVLRIIDFVDDRIDRETKKQYVVEHKDDKDAVDVIITMNMFQEGADWKYANRAFVVGVKGSQVTNVQILGRILRDIEGKKSVTLMQLIPTFPTTDQTKRREQINDQVTVMCLNMLLIDSFQPVEINVSLPSNGSSSGSSSGREKKPNYLKSLTLDEQVKIAVEARIAIAEIQDENPNPPSKQFVFEEFERRLVTILEWHGVTGHVEEIALKLWTMMNREQLVSRSLDGFTYDMLKAMDPMNGFLAHFAILNVKSFRDLVRAWKTYDTDANKRKLLAMPVGCPRPSSKTTKLGNALCKYVNKRKESYDPSFDKAIQERQPAWFFDAVAEAKKELMAMPVGCTRPLSTSRIGMLLGNYTRNGSNSYDEEFDNAIQERQPRWFVDFTAEKKKTMLSMPVGAPRPKVNTPMRKAMDHYLYKNGPMYDEAFDKAIHERHPSWFFDSSVDAKKELLSMPKDGKKPNFRKDKILRYKLDNYTYKHSGSYDQDFDVAIRKKHPEWFVHSSDRRKMELMLLKKKPKKHSTLGSCLYEYTHKNRDAYDHEFSKAIRKKHPEWWR